MKKLLLFIAPCALLPAQVVNQDVVIQARPGSTGPQGVQGPKGDTGAQGLQGIQGIQGSPGGQGAKGDVYAAVDENIGRRVAVRVMPPGQRPEVKGQVTHANVVTVFDRGEHQGQPYVVMELIEGTPLTEYVRQLDTQTLNAKIGSIR